MTKGKLRGFPRIMVFISIIGGVAALGYVGSRVATEYYHYLVVQKALKTKVGSNLQQQSERLAIALNNAKTLAKDLAEKNAPNTNVLLDEGAKGISRELATVATRNLFSYEANNAKGAIAKIVLLDASARELVEATPLREYAAEKVSGEILRYVPDNTSAFLAVANNRFLLAHPCKARGAVSGYLVIWLNGDALLEPPEGNEPLIREGFYALVAPAAGYTLLRTENLAPLSIIADTSITGKRNVDFYQDRGRNGGREFLQSLQIEIPGTPFSLAYVFPPPYFSKSSSTLFVWVLVLGLMAVLCGVYIFILRSRYEGLREQLLGANAEQTRLVAADTEREAVLAAIISEMRAHLTPLAVVLEGVYKKLANTIVPSLDKEASAVLQAGERTLENLEATLGSAQRVSALVGTLADFANCEKDITWHEEEEVNVEDLLRSLDVGLTLKISGESTGDGAGQVKVVTNRHFFAVAVENILRIAAATGGKEQIAATLATADDMAVLSVAMVVDHNGKKPLSYGEYAGFRSDGSSFIALAVAKKIIGLLKGSVTVEDKDGTVLITLTMPLAK